jgi:hypothetical protein
VLCDFAVNLIEQNLYQRKNYKNMRKAIKFMMYTKEEGRVSLAPLFFFLLLYTF